MAQASDTTVLLPAFCRGPVILRALVLAQAVAIVLAFAPGSALGAVNVAWNCARSSGEDRDGGVGLRNRDGGYGGRPQGDREESGEGQGGGLGKEA